MCSKDIGEKGECQQCWREMRIRWKMFCGGCGGQIGSRVESEFRGDKKLQNLQKLVTH